MWMEPAYSSLLTDSFFKTLSGIENDNYVATGTG